MIFNSSSKHTLNLSFIWEGSITPATFRVLRVVYLTWTWVCTTTWSLWRCVELYGIHGGWVNHVRSTLLTSPVPNRTSPLWPSSPNSTSLMTVVAWQICSNSLPLVVFILHMQQLYVKSERHGERYVLECFDQGAHRFDVRDLHDFLPMNLMAFSTTQCKFCNFPQDECRK
jgi:hypothetical protein